MFDREVAYLRESTPYLALDRQKVSDALEAFQKCFGARNVYYALKANSDPGLVSLLNDLDGNFEVSSTGELALMARLKVPASHMISSGPIKSPDFIRGAVKAGIRYFVADSPAEVDKLAALAPGSNIAVRLTVPNKGSEWPLTGKFGLPPSEAVEILERVRQKGLVPYGLTFHVGSQCKRPETWVEAIEVVKEAWNGAAQRGIFLKALNIGGGFPVQYRTTVPSVAEIAEPVLKTIRREIPDVQEILVEPGRGMVGNAGILVASVIGKAMRAGKCWTYLDVGVFTGLAEAHDGIRYAIVTEKTGNGEQSASWTEKVLSGPTCDSVDVIDKEAVLPDMEVGERVLILGAGAYTTAYNSIFGGVPAPEVVLIDRDAVTGRVSCLPTELGMSIVR